MTFFKKENNHGKKNEMTDTTWVNRICFKVRNSLIYKAQFLKGNDIYGFLQELTSLFYEHINYNMIKNVLQ